MRVAPVTCFPVAFSTGAEFTLFLYRRHEFLLTIGFEDKIEHVRYPNNHTERALRPILINARANSMYLLPICPLPSWYQEKGAAENCRTSNIFPFQAHTLKSPHKRGGGTWLHDMLFRGSSPTLPTF